MKKFGIIKNKNIITHRTILKIVLNPILRKIGWSIVSHVEDDRFIKYEIRSYPQNCRVIK